MSKRLLILGGYGGTGRALAWGLLEHTGLNLTIAGRNLEHARDFCQQLRQNYPQREILPAQVDARDIEGMKEAFRHIDLVVVTGTVPEYIDRVVQASLESETDCMDILFQSGVAGRLHAWDEPMRKAGRRCITQAGFHPGMVAPLIRYAARHFDRYQRAEVYLAMNAAFEKPESAYEIIREAGQNQSLLLEGGVWRKATFKDARKMSFAGALGSRSCYPLRMVEVESLTELGLTDIGVYSAGFNWFTDNVVFTLAYLLQALKPGLGVPLCGRLMHWGVKLFYNGIPEVEMKLVAHGLRSGAQKQCEISLYSGDPYALTAQSVIACLNQYLDGTISRPGLHLMGLAIDPARAFSDLSDMDVSITHSCS